MRIPELMTWMMVCGVVASACGGDPMAGQPDSGAGIDGGEEIPLCGRDADCSDGRFCNGEERCMPGEPDADARGCVVFPAPCEVDECDEDTETCRMCAVPDADDDNVASIPCGGTDCDDTRGDVYPGALEVCDAAGIDEDCDPTTLGTDADGDGAYAPECCYQPPDGPLECGQDCDDSNSAIGPHAPERCNGIDDDCDGAIDEDFDCVQSQDVRGVNACGREGTRRCSETCSWLDDTFSRAESASTCDYCDDSGDGLGDEIPFATEMGTTEVTAGWMDHGDARLKYVYPTTWAVVDGPDERGGLYAPTPVRLGYGATYIEALVRTTANQTPECACYEFGCFNALGGAWALTVLAGSPLSFLGTGSHMEPETSGIAVEWNFDVRWLSDFCAGSDRLRLKQLRAGGAPVTLGSTVDALPGAQDGPSGTVADQMIGVEIISDDPRTVSDESAVTVYIPNRLELGCANDGVAEPCGMSFLPGMELQVGMIGDANSRGDVSVFARSLTVRQLDGLCSAP